ncbi:MAG TPA: glycosyltransferase family 39 protein [Candidatus Sulfotelmatobacter sp.]|nr:glycosyltransferase family 39 protein [Candidatus Sulfotelmatobacter sp.]
MVEPPRRSQLWPWLFVLLVLLLTGFIRYRLLDMPLERDEGEYACSGQFIMAGIPPYQQVWNMKLPGTYLAYALGMAVFGQTVAGIHATLMVVNCLTIILVFLLGERLFGTIAGLAACATYGVLSASPAVLGLAAHATQFVVLFAVWGALRLWKTEEFYRWHAMFFSGLLFGLAFLMKQQAICFCVFAVAVVFWNAIQTGTIFKPVFIQKLFFLGVGMLLPFALLCVYLRQAGLWPKFWFWTFSYAHAYAAENTLHDAAHWFLYYAHRHWLVYFPFAGFVFVSLPFVTRDRALRSQIIFAATLLFCSAIGTSIDFYFRQHYFILALPALAILVGLAIVSLQFATENNIFKIVPPLVCILILGWSVYLQRDVFFKLSPDAAVQQIYPGESPFTEMPAVGSYIRNHSGAGASMAVIGSEPELYFYAQRPPATGYLYTYPFTEHQPFAAQMRAEMISEIETNRPEYMVFVNNPGSGPDTNLFNWFANYSKAHYTRVAVVEQIANDKTKFVADNSITNYHKMGPEYVGVFRRAN